MRKAIVVMLAAAMLAAGCGRRAQVTELSIVPEPLFTLQKDGSYTLDRNPRLTVSGVGQNSPTVKYVLKSLRQVHRHPRLVSPTVGGDIELVINDTVNTELGDEGYLLEVRPTGIRLSANTEAGLFYAYQTFIQMLPADVNNVNYSSITIPECTILDAPRYSWRGVHLDVCRHFFPMKFIKHYLDIMAAYKMNRFHFH